MRQFLKGNDAVVRGAIAAGCKAYFGYPITPASEIAEQASLLIPQSGGIFVPARVKSAPSRCFSGRPQQASGG